MSNTGEDKKLRIAMFHQDSAVIEDMKDILANSSLTTQDIENLSVSALVTQIMSKGDKGDKARLRALLARVQDLKSGGSGPKSK